MADHDALAAAVIAAERDADAEGWDGERRLYALTDRDTYLDTAYPLDELTDLPPGTLLAIPLTPLPGGDLRTELTKVTWPDNVHGCVLIAEMVVRTALVRRPRGMHVRWRLAHLAIGVLRDGHHLSLLRLRGTDEWRSGADDLVPSLLATFGTDGHP
ncbi:PPA1309 family protein [Nonomuraea sp. NPDC050394]|uniref:PPA1309 family protein n=1 Tax=Nonomuraea sp. NPDC050394 TaxID=3364363 RepID=UPI0037B16C4A